MRAMIRVLFIKRDMNQGAFAHAHKGTHAHDEETIAFEQPQNTQPNPNQDAYTPLPSKIPRFPRYYYPTLRIGNTRCGSLSGELWSSTVTSGGR